MGVIPLLKKTYLIAGAPWEVQASTTTGDLSRPEGGTLQIVARPKDADEWTHRCDAPVTHAGGAFLDRFISAFVQLEGFRARCALLSGRSLIDIETNHGQDLPKIPAVPALGVSAHVARVAGLGNKASFRDFATLRSGRDAYSTMQDDALQRLLGETVPEVDRHISRLPVPLGKGDRIKVLRWTARGLPPNMALRKVLTDLEVSAKAKPRKRK